MDLVRENGPDSPWQNKGGCCGREDSAVPFLGDDRTSLPPWYMQGQPQCAASLLLNHSQSRRARAGHGASSLMTILCITDFQ